MSMIPFCSGDGAWLCCTTAECQLSTVCWKIFAVINSQLKTTIDSYQWCFTLLRFVPFLLHVAILRALASSAGVFFQLVDIFWQMNRLSSFHHSSSRVGLLRGWPESMSSPVEVSGRNVSSFQLWGGSEPTLGYVGQKLFVWKTRG